MRRASDSERTARAEDARRSRPSRILLRGLLVAGIVMAIPTPVFALEPTPAPADDGAGKLEVNLSVLTNAREGTGSAGDFPARTMLFTGEVDRRADEAQRADAARLGVIDALDFSHGVTATGDFSRVREDLFTRVPPATIPTVRSDEESSAPLPAGVVVAMTPVVLASGVLLARLWARGKRGRRDRSDHRVGG